MTDEFCVCPRCGMFEPVLETVSPRTENHAGIVKCKDCNKFYPKDELFRHDMTYEKNFGREEDVIKMCGKWINDTLISWRIGLR